MANPPKKKVLKWRSFALQPKTKSHRKIVNTRGALEITFKATSFRDGLVSGQMSKNYNIFPPFEFPLN
jgi:hypothetical protein